MKKSRDPAWKPAEYVLADVMAIKALAAGTADADQQKRALQWIIYSACETYEMPFRSDADGGARDTDLALGRMFAGQQIVKLVNLPAPVIEAMRKK